MADPVDKTRGQENTCTPNRSESMILNQKRAECEPHGGSRIKPRKTNCFSEVCAGNSGYQKTALHGQGTLTQRGSDDGQFENQTPSNFFL